MGRSLIDQDFGIGSSLSFDDAVTDSHLITVAEATGNLEEDLNILRTRLKNVLGVANWYEQPDSSLADVSGKFFIHDYHLSSFENVAIAAAGSTNAFDTAIKTITNHNDGGGNSTTEGVLVFGTKAYKIELLDHATQNAIDDGAGNQVYGKLTWSGTEYIVTWYSWVNAVETAYTFASAEDIDIAVVAASIQYSSLPWDRFINTSFHDLAGLIGSINDEDVVVDGMANLLVGLVTQAAVNAKLDKLGLADTDGEGAYGVGFDDSATGTNNWFATGSLQGVLEEIVTLIGYDSSTTMNFTSDGVALVDNDNIADSLDNINEYLKAINTADVNGSGSDLVSVNDQTALWTATDLTGVLIEIDEKASASQRQKEQVEVAAPIAAGATVTLPNSMSATVDNTNSAYLDISRDGMDLFGGLTVNSDDFEQLTATTIKYLRPVPAGKNLIYVSHG